METQKNALLIIAAALSGLAALLHLACIYFGAPLFRFLGAAALAAMYESGNFLHPVVACLVLATILSIWSVYALSGAGAIRKLPFLRAVLVCITVIYLIRGIAFPFVAQYFPENTALFWYCSSLIVFIIGVIHLLGIRQVWKRI